MKSLSDHPSTNSIDSNAGVQSLLRLRKYLGCPRGAVVGPAHERRIDDVRTAKESLVAHIGAVDEAERLLSETFDRLNPDNERDRWFMVRITKIREALADRGVK